MEQNSDSEGKKEREEREGIYLQTFSGYKCKLEWLKSMERTLYSSTFLFHSIH